MRNLTRAFFMVLALSCATYAGEMPFPAPTAQSTPTVTSAGEMPFPVSNTQSEPANAQEPNMVIGVALNLLGNVLALF
jgi:hypothetical protein